MAAMDDTAGAVETLVVALNQVQALLTAGQASINTARDELLRGLGVTRDPRVLRAARFTIDAVQCSAEAARHLQSAIDGAYAFAAELGLSQLKCADTAPDPAGTLMGLAVPDQVNDVANAPAHGVMTGDTPLPVYSSGWTSPESLDRHFIDHGAELGHYLKEDYEQASKELMCGPCRAGVKEKESMIEGKIYRWDPETNEFGVKDRAHYLNFGASERRRIQRVRPPGNGERQRQ